MITRAAILHVTPHYFDDRSVIGGGERYVTYMTRAIHKASGGLVIQSVLAPSYKNDRIVANPADLILFESRTGAPGFKSLELVADAISQFDVVHIHQCLSAFGLAMAAIAKAQGKLTVGTDHGGGEEAMLSTAPQLSSIYDHFHSQSEYARSAFASLDAPTTLIRGPIDDDIYQVPNTAHDSCKSVLSIGRILPHKGFETIIEALPGSLSLTIVGRPYDEEYAHHLVNVSRGKQVTFKYNADDSEINQLHATASIYVQASTTIDYRGGYHPKSELLGLAPLEALVRGTTTLVRKCAALTELTVLSGCEGFTSVSELSELLGRMTSDKVIHPSRHTIREETINRYGSLQFGNSYLKFILS